MKRYGRTTVGGASGASLRDFHNYLVTCPTIDGEWSDPVYLNSSGFDPSLFHDDDGRKYLVNMLWDHRPGRNRFGGIVLQEYSPAQRKLIGERQNIFKGTPIGFTEAPHLYKRNGYYYLITAEGGTGWGHAMTMARSRSLTGPYELHPDKYIITARDRPHAPLQRAGHGDLVDTQAGDTYAVYLCGRPLPQSRPLRARPRDRDPEDGLGQGRLAAHAGWQSGLPELETPAPALPAAPFHRLPRAREDFDGEQAAHRLPVAALAVPGGIVQPERAARLPAAVRPRNHRQPVPAVAGGASPAGPLLQRDHRHGIRAARTSSRRRDWCATTTRPSSTIYT